MPTDQTDHGVIAFLALLEEELKNHPERVSAFPAELIERGRALTAGIAFDLDEPLE